MPFEPCRIKYDLSRRQRLSAHLGVWLPYLGTLILFVGLLVLFIWMLSSVSPWYYLLLIFPWMFISGLVRGFLNVIFIPVYHMDIIIEEKALGFMLKGERFWIFFDGITGIKKYNKDMWTIIHRNGTVIYIPVNMIERHYIDHMQDMADKGKTREGVRAIVERGRRIMEIEAEERQQRRNRKKGT